MKRIISKIKNIIRWIPVLWNDYDWDHWFIYHILKTKLKHQSEHIRKYGYHENANYDANRIDLCIRLLEKVQNEEYIEIPKDELWTKEAMDASIAKHDKARKLLFKILEQNIERWWD
jgi:hypothetical protein